MPPSSNQEEETQPLDSTAATDEDDFPSSSVDPIETLAGETEQLTMMGDSVLYGETQPIDDDVGGDEGDGTGTGICTWMETQPVDDDDDANDGGGENGMGEWEETQVVDDSDDCEIGDDGGVDSDASTEDEGDREGDHVTLELPQSGDSCKSSNGSVRSIASIRAASLRSSGLAAAQAKSFFDNGNNYTTAKEMMTPNISVVHTKMGEVDGDVNSGNSQKCTQDYCRDENQSRTKNPVVKKLIYEETTTGHLDLPCSLVPDNIAGLSYIESQEPGDLSQANALDVVDKFLGCNDLGLSQEATNKGKNEMVKSPPKLSAKGAQFLAIKTNSRSPVGKKGAFEWIDNLEDEGGGEFFSRRKDSFFNNKNGAGKSCSQPPKPKNARSGIAEKVGIPSNQRKIHSDSRLMRSGSLRNEKVHVAESRTKKNLFDDLNEQLNSKSSEQQLETANFDRGEGGVYEVGPDTQMAAEAIEALVHGSPINYETHEAHTTTGNPSKIHSESAAKKKTSSRSSLSRKPASSIPGCDKKKMLPTRSKQGRFVFSKSNSRRKQSSECKKAKTKSKTEEKRSQQNLNKKSTISENICCVSLNGENAKGEVDKSCNSLTLNVQLSVREEFIQGEVHVSSTPIAHRTRHSKAGKLSKPTESVVTNGKTRRTTTKRKCPDNSLGQKAIVEENFSSHRDAQDVKDLPGDEKDSSHVVTHPKRRRTRPTTPGIPNANDNLNNPSMSMNAAKTRAQQGNITIKFKTIAEILDTAKRKRRSISSQITSKIDGLTSDGGKAVSRSGVRTRSSVKTSLLKPNIQNGSMQSLPMPVIQRAASADVGNLSSRTFTDGTDVEVAKENGKQEESPKQRLQPAVSKDVNVVSPICVAQGQLRTPGNRGRSRSSIVRELLQLETSTLSPTSMVTMRRRKDMANIRVLFSHHLDDDIIKHQKKIMGRLGMSLAFSISDATHFITDNFVRTRNMLEAMAQGKPVVTHMWLESCGQASCFIDEKNYILRDAKKEKEIGFNMPVSLSIAGKSPLLLGRRVYITPNTKPSREVVSSLVKATQGQPVERIGRSVLKDDKIPDDLLVLSCEEDYSVCIPLLEKGAEVFSSELLLNGIVIQNLEYERHRLFLDLVKRTRSTIWLRLEDGSQFVPVAKCT